MLSDIDIHQDLLRSKKCLNHAAIYEIVVGCLCFYFREITEKIAILATLEAFVAVFGWDE
ncbi:MAG: hypothetical protein AAGC54_19160, partial [Cyanobacteria bacterium P01_F01_bin.4]